MDQKQATDLAAMVDGGIQHTGGGIFWVVVHKADGSILCYADAAVYHYRDQAAFEAWHNDGDQSGLIGAVEFNS